MLQPWAVVPAAEEEKRVNLNLNEPVEERESGMSNCR